MNANIDDATLAAAESLRGQPVSTQEYLLAIRPKLVLYALFGTLMCMGHLTGSWVWECVFAGLVVALLTSGIMIWNDYFDRYHDIGKDRTLAVRQPKRFLGYVIGVWLVTLGGIAWVWLDNPFAGWVLAAMALNGFVYGWFRVVPLLSGLSVAFSFAGLVLIAGAYAPDVSTFSIGVLFICILAMAFGRENTADLEDLEIDTRYKATLSVTFGKDIAVSVISVVTVVSVGAALFISPWCVVVVPFTLKVMVGLRERELDFDRLQKLYDVQCLLVMVILPFVKPS